MCVYLLANIEVSSIIPTSFRQGVILPPPPAPLPPHQKKYLKSPPRLGLKEQINYSLTHKSLFKIRRTKTIRNGFKSISYLGPKNWEIFRQDIRNVSPV